MKKIGIFSDDLLFARTLMHEISFACNKRDIEIKVNEIAFSIDENKDNIMIVDLDSGYSSCRFYTEKVIGFSRSEENKYRKNGALCVEFFRRPFLLCDFVEAVLKYTEENILIQNFNKITDIEQEKLLFNAIDCSIIFLGNKIHLSKNEFEILFFLNEHKNETVSRQEINLLLGGDHGNMSDVYICRLRTKLSKYSNQNVIYTVRKTGYTLKI